MLRLIITCGDPNGIGLEVCIKALMRCAEELHPIAEVSLAVSPATFWDYYSQLQQYLTLPVKRVESGFVINDLECRIIPCAESAKVEFGKETVQSGAVSWEALRMSAKMLREGSSDAVITMPVSKRALHLAGYPYPGQTEFFAKEFPVNNTVHTATNTVTNTRTNAVMMILATEAAELDPKHSPVRVGLATIHVPLQRVAELISTEHIHERVHALHQTLQQDFGIAAPRIAVLGLNPHAGEQGDIGVEEQTSIEPALQRAREQGVNVQGAFPADGFFAHGAYRNFDGILAMYHDQGLIPLKLLAGNGGVNFSAGLPIVRTSPDHGTAFALAGKGIANESSVVDALRMAVNIVQNRRKPS
jgi:4-hydroxythreonine-4-phosphate dehydrogenase